MVCPGVFKMRPRIKKFFIAALSLLGCAILLTQFSPVEASNGVSGRTFNPGKTNTSDGHTSDICADPTIVTTTADSGVGSLREAIGNACIGGTITFDPALTSGGPA